MELPCWCLDGDCNRSLIFTVSVALQHFVLARSSIYDDEAPLPETMTTGCGRWFKKGVTRKASQSQGKAVMK